MARPPTNHEAKKAEILAAALKSFATYGYEGTSNKTIAKEGGFKSPALLYHYFPGGKPELFVACIKQISSFRAFEQQLSQPHADEPPEVYLRGLARAYLGLIGDETVKQLLRLIIAEAPRFPELVDLLPQQLAPVIVMPFATYLGQQAQAGHIEMGQPIAMIMSFFGPLLVRVLLGQIVEGRATPLPLPSEDEMVEMVVQTFLHGVWRVGLPPEGGQQ